MLFETSTVLIILHQFKPSRTRLLGVGACLDSLPVTVSPSWARSWHGIRVWFPVKVCLGDCAFQIFLANKSEPIEPTVMGKAMQVPGKASRRTKLALDYSPWPHGIEA